MNPGLFSKYCVRIQKPLHAPDYLTQTYVPRVQNSNEFFNINGIISTLGFYYCLDVSFAL